MQGMNLIWAWTSVLRDTGFLDAVRSGQIIFAVFHILGPSVASLDEIAETANFMNSTKYFLGKPDSRCEE